MKLKLGGMILDINPLNHSGRIFRFPLRELCRSVIFEIFKSIHSLQFLSDSAETWKDDPRHQFTQSRGAGFSYSISGCAVGLISGIFKSIHGPGDRANWAGTWKVDTRHQFAELLVAGFLDLAKRLLWGHAPSNVAITSWPFGVGRLELVELLTYTSLIYIILGRIVLGISLRSGSASDFHGSYVEGNLALHIAIRLLDKPQSLAQSCIILAMPTLEW